MITQNTDIIKKIKERIPYLTSCSFTLVIKLANISLNNYKVHKKGEPHISIINFTAGTILNDTKYIKK